MTSDSSRDELYQLWVLQRRVSHLISNVRNNELSQYGISMAEAAALAIVYAMDGKATPAEISRQIMREAHTVSSLVTRMSRKGLVNKVPDAERKNVVRVSLTEKGRQLYYQAMKIESISEIMSALSAEERRQLQMLLQKLRRKAIERLAKTRKLPFAVEETETPGLR